MKKGFLNAIGPAFMTAAVVIGPGSVTTMTKAGAAYGYQLLWLPIAMAILMGGFTLLFMRFGLYSDKTFFDVVAARCGRVFSVVCGFSAFYIAAGFQFGNNLGVTTAMAGLLPNLPLWVWPVLFNVLSILFLFAFKRTYLYLEKMMVVMVVAMLLAFVANLFVAGVEVGRAASGLIVRIPPDLNWGLIGGLVATTFSILAAINQVYLVRSKGWTREDYATGRTDTLTGIAMLALISMVVMMTSATVLHRHNVQIKNAGDMATQLNALFGASARIIFCLGFGAAAFSSFIMNAMIGGVLFSDSMGRSWRLTDPLPKALGTAALLIGMAVALLVLQVKEISVVDCVVFAQAGTLLAVPLAAVCTYLVLFWRGATPDRPLGLGSRIFVGVGVLVLFAVSARTAIVLAEKALIALRIGV